jgi:Protein of unknown function (DUF2975)
MTATHSQSIASAARAIPTRRHHLWIGWFFFILASVLPAAVLWYALTTPISTHLQALGMPAMLSKSLPGGLGLQVQMAALMLLPVAGLSYALWHAGRCSGAFARGQSFQRDVARALGRCAVGMAVAALAGMVLPSLMSLLLSWHLNSGPRALVVSVNSQALILLAFAALIWQIAAVLRQGIALAEENAQFV